MIKGIIMKNCSLYKEVRLGFSYKTTINILKYLNLLVSGLLSRFHKRNPQKWVFGEWFGKKCCDNSMWFANYIAQNYPEIEIIWVTKKNTDVSSLNKRIRIVELGSLFALKQLLEAGVVVAQQSVIADTSDYMSFWSNGALTANLWHGVPWKHIGQDIIDSRKDVSVLKKEFHRFVAKYSNEEIFLSLSKNFTEIIKKTYFPKKIIEAGYPRNSIFYSPDSIETCRNKILNFIARHFNIELKENVKIITYMPTFRDKSEKSFSFEELLNNERFNEILTKYNCYIVQKAHFVSNERGAYRSYIDNSRIINLNDVAGQKLLAATDMLITDYSSCFFDFLLLDRPIIHYLYDYDYYANQDRGLYYPKEEVVCGDVAENLEELISAIEANLLNPDKDKNLRRIRKEKFLTFESPNSCEIIYQEIIKELKKKYGDINF